MTLTRTGNYYNPTSTGSSNISTSTDLKWTPDSYTQEGTTKVNSFDLYRELYIKRAEIEVENLNIPAVNSSQQYNSFYTYELTAPDIPGTEKSITGSVEDGWTITYKRIMKEVPITALFIGPNAVNATEHSVMLDVYQRGKTSSGPLYTEEFNHANSEVIKVDSGEYHYVLLVKKYQLPAFDLVSGEPIKYFGQFSSKSDPTNIETGGVVYSHDGGGANQQGYPVHARFVERNDPNVKVVFDGLEPQDITMTVTRIGNYYVPTSTNSSEILSSTDLKWTPTSYTQEGTTKVNSYDLYTELYYKGNDIPVTSLEYPSVNSTQQYKSFNTFTLDSSDVPNAKKVITGSVEEGWIITYTSTIVNPNPTPAPTPTSTPKVSPNPGRTCQDDGYPAGYTWDDAKQACVLTSPTSLYKVPNTGATGSMIPLLGLGITSALGLILLNKKRK